MMILLKITPQLRALSQPRMFSTMLQTPRISSMSKIVTQYLCNNCRQRLLGARCISTTPYYHKQNTKKKLIRPVTFQAKKSSEIVGISHNMTVRELAKALGKDIDHVFEALCYIDNTDRFDRPNKVIDDFHVIKEVVKKSGMRFKMVSEKKEKKEKENKDIEKRPPAEPAMLKRRPPVVTIMGHVDHGKTTLLDALRNSNIVDQEFGGITQHIGAFSVKLSSGEAITFLDTPGHAAFSNMRARGAHVTDLVVLVVAADDGPMQQTRESAEMALSEDVSIIVAVNKIDKPEADIEAAKRSLAELGLVIEEYGGDVQVIPVSALKGTNLDQLQEAIVTLSEILEIKADPVGMVEGSIIESKTDPGRGKLSTVLVQRGTLRKGSVVVAGTAWAKVRGMFNDMGRPVQEAAPGTAVEVIGWRELPSAGDEMLQAESEARAREVISWRMEQEKMLRQESDAEAIKVKAEEHDRDYKEKRTKALARGRRRTHLYRKERTKEVIITHTGPELAVVIKGDVDGTLEAILDVIDTYESDQCRLHLLHYGIGDINESDLEMAASFGGIVYGFNVKLAAAKKAYARNVPVQLHNVIYKMFDELREELSSRIPPLEQEVTVGEANVQQIFTITDDKNRKVRISGCRCVKGSLHKKKSFKLLREGEIVAEGNLKSLKHFKNEVDTIKTDVECGLAFEDTDIEPEIGDQIICYEVQEIKQEIDWDLQF